MSLVWRFRGNNNSVKWWISENWSKSWSICGRFVFVIFHRWIGELYARRILLLSIIRSLCGRLFNSHSCIFWNHSRFMDLWNESILWRYTWYGWFLSGSLLAHLLEICCARILAIYHRFRIVWTSAIAIWQLFLSRLGQQFGMVYSRFISYDDSIGCNH